MNIRCVLEAGTDREALYNKPHSHIRASISSNIHTNTSYLPKDTLAHIREQPGIQPPIFILVTYSHPPSHPRGNIIRRQKNTSEELLNSTPKHSIEEAESGDEVDGSA